MKVIALLFISGVAVVAQPQSPQPSQLTPDFTFKAQARIVEVYATITDKKGNWVPDLDRDRFQLFEQGSPRAIEQFERFDNANAPLSLVVLLDTTGSMKDALPVLKNSVGGLIDHLRPGDSVAVFGFSERLHLIQDFTDDRKAAKLATRRIRAEGKTALFDALSHAVQAVSKRSGKKAIVAFTDGDDNSSVLTMQSAVARARKAGVPVYSIAQGEAAKSDRLVDTLDALSRSTGARCYRVNKSSQMDEVFTAIADELKNTYLLAFRPDPGAGEWRSLRVAVKDQPSLKIRSREGYFAE